MTTAITYKPLTQSSVYTKTPTETYPTVDMIGPIQVVSRIDTANGIGGTYRKTTPMQGRRATRAAGSWASGR